MTFTVHYYNQPKRFLKKVPNTIARKIYENIRNLTENPFPKKVKSIKTKGNVYRKRAGKYRILYEVCPEDSSITIVKIDHRKRIYK